MRSARRLSVGRATDPPEATATGVDGDNLFMRTNTTAALLLSLASAVIVGCGAPVDEAPVLPAIVVEDDTVVAEPVAFRAVGTVAGVVCNVHTGQFMAGAHVEVLTAASPHVAGIDRIDGSVGADHAVTDVVADEAGAFSAAVPAGSALVTISADGFRKTVMVTVEADAESFLDLSEGC